MGYEKWYDAVTHRGEGSLETRSYALDRSHYVWCAGGRAPAMRTHTWQSVHSSALPASGSAYSSCFVLVQRDAVGDED